MPLDTFRDLRRGRPQESESISSIQANPPVSPNHSRDGSPVPSDRATGQLTTDISNVSLSVNYLPSKFSSGVLYGGGGGGGGDARRRPGVRESFPGVPKMGGGVDVFKSGEARMGGEGDGNDDDDDDEDGDTRTWFVRGRKQNLHPLKKKLRWNKFKWILFVSNILVESISLFFQNSCFFNRCLFFFPS